MMLTRVSTIFPYLLITLLCVGGVELFYRGVERYLFKPVTVEQPVAEEVAEPVSSVKTPTRAVDFSIITSRNLFGPPPAERTDTESEDTLVDEELEPTTLDVVLMGTIDGTEQGSRAIILNKRDRKQEIYQVGDTVEGALIKEIQRGKVILSVNGRDEMLDMSEAAQYGQSTPQAAAAQAMARRRATLTPSPQITGGAGQGTVERPRVVRPSRRVVRPRNVDPTDLTPESPPDVEEDLPPDVEDQDIQEPAVDEQDTPDQQDIQDENVEEPAVE